MDQTGDDLGSIEAEVTMRRTEDGGRRIPVRTGYPPNWWLPGEAGHVWAGGSVEIVGADEVAPGGTAAVRIYPFAPDEWALVEPGSSLELCEGPVLVGKATVTRVVLAVASVSTGS